MPGKSNFGTTQLAAKPFFLVQTLQICTSLFSIGPKTKKGFFFRESVRGYIACHSSIPDSKSIKDFNLREDEHSRSIGGTAPIREG